MSSLRNKKVALVYDRVNKWGGAERILITLHELFPDAPLYTALYNKDKASWAYIFNVKKSFLSKFPYASNHHDKLAVAMPLAFENFSFDKFDIVISLTSESAKGIITKPHTKHICYCLTPTRYLWSGYNEYFKNFIIRFISKPAVFYLKKWDFIASFRPDAYIAISDEVRKRIKTFYQKDSYLLYPPVNISNTIYKKQNHKIKDSFLIVSRLVDYKRIDIAINACNKLKLPLMIIGKGSKESYLKSISGPTVKFMGMVDDQELASYYSNCKALIFPGYEDFGLVMAEALSYGRPVIAYKRGGALEIVENYKTGLFFEPQTVDGLIRAIKDFDNYKFDNLVCRKAAEKFNKNNFKKNFMQVLEKIVLN